MSQFVMYTKISLKPSESQGIYSLAPGVASSDLPELATKFCCNFSCIRNQFLIHYLTFSSLTDKLI